MCDKYDKTIIKVSEWDEVYIVKYIAKSLNKFVLISVVHHYIQRSSSLLLL